MKDCNGKEIKVGDIVICDTRDILLDIHVGTEMTKIDILDKIIVNLSHKKPDKDIGVTVEKVIKAVEKLKELEKEHIYNKG